MTIDTAIGKCTNKQLKAMQILEILNPKRSEEVRKDELSDALKKVRDERE